MCGIAGWYRRRNRPVDGHIVKAQCDRILHRGPDDEGAFVDDDFGFGMRRLSIIDIEGGHQPMLSEDGRHVIVFNGEIYNHHDVRRELGGNQHFKSHSDTETILAAYRQWGDDAWVRLEGMYAVAIWDKAARSLTLARDPLGIKPLYVTEQDDGLAFASELKALTPIPGLAYDVNPAAVHDFFSFGHVRQPRSIYRQVRQLEPGHVLTIGPTGEARQRAFWQASYRPAEPKSPAEWIDEFRERWLRTVKSHMLADVPVGVFLSGGVDSSAVTAAMARFSDRPVKAFTIGFPGTPFDETRHARAVAEHFGCEHHVQTVDLRSAADILPRLNRCFDEPFADPAAVPTWYVSELAARHVKVVLAGEGGDELFAGYKRHRNEMRMARLAPLLRPLSPAIAALDRMPATQWRGLNLLRQRLRRFHETSLLPDGVSRFFAKTQITSPAFWEGFYDASFLERFGPASDHRLSSPADISSNELEQFIFADLTINLPSAMLTKVDRTTMDHSLEARVPFLSHTLVDWALTMPIEMKMRGGIGKYVVREAIKPWLPPRTTERGKQGFQVPLADWFAGDLGTFAREIWYDSGAARSGFFDVPAFDRILAEHRAGISNNGRMLHAATMFGLWWGSRQSAVAA